MIRHTANTITDEALDELYTRAEQLEELLRVAEETSNRSEAERARAEQRANVLEHVAEGNKRHVQAIVPELEKVEAALARVRALIAPWKQHGLDLLPPTLVARLVDEALVGLNPPPDDGPTVREAAAADRNWDVEKAGE